MWYKIIINTRAERRELHRCQGQGSQVVLGPRWVT
jgi:hypothetical protein